jgi:lipopolysaccharide export system protein LptA
MWMKRLFLGSLILLWAVLALGVAKDPERFRLIHADKLFMSNQESGQILQLNGNVHFFYGDTEFKSDRALILDTQKIARLSGRVVVENDTLHLVADSLAYYRIPQLLNLGGRVRLTQSTKDGFSRWMQGDHGIYDQGKDTFAAFGRVKAYDQKENGFAECGYGFWDRPKGYAYLIEEPRVSAGTTDTLYISADKMEYYDAERKLIATFNVRTESRDYQATSDFLIYFADQEKAVFIGEPRFENAFATAEAQEFQLFFEEQELRRVVLVDSCLVNFAQEEDAEKQNWVRARNIVLNFAEGKIEDFEADAEVSYYFLQQETDKQDFFINAAIGERLRAKFDLDNKLRLMDMGGSIKGRYIFKNDS